MNRLANILKQKHRMKHEQVRSGIFTGLLVIILGLFSFKNSSKSNTVISIKGEQFYINDEITYKGRNWNNQKIEGLLFNSRMVQGIFDDLNAETRENFIYPDTKKWEPERNTQEFINE